MPDRTCDLSLTERLLLWAARHWIRARAAGRDLPRYVRRTLTMLHGDARLADALESALALLVLGAPRPLGFAAPEAARLRHDEQHLLLAVRAAGAGLADEVRHVLADLQTAAGLRSSTAAIRILADHLDPARRLTGHGDERQGRAQAGRPVGRFPAPTFIEHSCIS